MSRAWAMTTGVVVIAFLGGSVLAILRGQNDSCGSVNIAGGAIGGGYTLVNGAGQSVTDKDVITEPTIIYFGYSFCPDVCPLDNARNAAVVDILADQEINVTPVFITIDPARDTPEVVADYVANFHPKMVGLTGSEEEVKAAANAYRVLYSRQDDDPEFYLMNHTVFSYLVTPDRGFVDVFRREDLPEEVARITSCHLSANR